MKPLISICIPNYNNAKYLEACIQSALNQTYENIEIILVDDCSLDESLGVAQKYSDKIKIYTNKTNIGQPKNTNKCFKLSKGKYLVILHSDDMLLPDFATKLVPLLQDNPNVCMAVGERMITDETGVPKKIAPFYNVNCIVPGIKQAKIFMMTSFLPCQVLLRRDIFEKIGGVDERHIVNLDGLLWFKCTLVGDLAYIQDPVSIYRIHGDQTTAKCNKTIDHMIDYYATLREMFELGKNIPYLKQHFPDAIKRVGELTVRYSHYVMKDKNYELAKRYLALATVFNPEIINNEHYKMIQNSLEVKDAEPFEVYNKLVENTDFVNRKISYSPPDGSLEIK